MTRLVHLNGPPGIGKSTLARRYTDEHAGVLNCDIDVLRTFVGGWRDDFAAAGALIRPAALGMIRGYLQGGDVVLPQMLARPVELARFHGAARDAGAEVVHLMLLAQPSTALARFHDRDATTGHDHVVRRVVATSGGDAELRRLHAALRELAASTPGTLLLDTTGHDADATYADLLTRLPR